MEVILIFCIVVLFESVIESGVQRIVAVVAFVPFWMYFMSCSHVT